MALGTRRLNTMQEALQSLLADIATMQAMPDADLDFLTSLQALLIQKIREPMQRYLQMTGAVPQAPTGTGPLGAVPSPVPGPPAGLRNGIALPPVDELRRLVGQSYG